MGDDFQTVSVGGPYGLMALETIAPWAHGPFNFFFQKWAIAFVSQGLMGYDFQTVSVGGPHGPMALGTMEPWPHGPMGYLFIFSKSGL